MIRLENVRKAYPGFELNLSMEVPRGRVSGLIGKNGAGKSTTIKAILGLIRPDGGTVEVFGKRADALSEQEKMRIGAGLAESGWAGLLRAKDVIRILQDLYPNFDETGFMKLCRELDLPMDKTVKDYSTGMKAKLRVITALTHRADLLVLDEPTAGLDVYARTEILQVIQACHDANPDSTVLISSHISSDLEGLCDDVYLIHDGRLILREDTKNILDRYGVLIADEAMYEQLDKVHILRMKKEKGICRCYTDQLIWYREKYPELKTENTGIDELILMMTGRNET